MTSKLRALTIAFASVVALAAGVAIAGTWENPFVPGGFEGNAVYGLASYNHQLYAAGQFAQVDGQAASCLARWDGTDWTPLPEFGTTLSSIRSVVLYNGNLACAGDFTITRSSQAAIEDCALLTSGGWMPLKAVQAMSGSPQRLAVVNGDLYGAGSWFYYPPIEFRYVQRWSAADSTWVPVAPNLNGGALALTEFGGKLVVGGSFTGSTAGALPRLAMLDGGDWVVPAGLGAISNGDISKLAVYDGKLYVAGSFTNLGGLAIPYLACWDGATWSVVGSGVPSAPWSLTALPDGLLVVGDYTSVGGVSCDHAVLWNGTSWSAFGGGLRAMPGGSVLCALEYDGQLLLGGTFTRVGTPERKLPLVAAWTGTDWEPAPGRRDAAVFGAWRIVNALGAYGSELAVGGHFEGAGSVCSANIALWTGDDWHGLGTGTNDAVNAVVEYAGDLFVAGRFTQAGGVAAPGLARWDGAQWHAIPGSGAIAEEPFCLAAYNGALYIGCRKQGDTLDSQVLWRWDGVNLTNNIIPEMDGVVRALHVHDGSLYVGGDWLIADLPNTCLLRYRDGVVHDVPGVTPGLVTAMESRGDHLLVANNCGYPSGVHLFDFDPADGAWSVFGEPLVPMNSASGGFETYTVCDILGNGGDVFTMGNLGGSVSTPFQDIGLWRTDVGWTDIGGLNSGYDVAVLQLFQGRVIVGGNLSTAGPLTVGGLACFVPDAPASAPDVSGGGVGATCIAQPNPFNPRTSIRFAVPIAGRVSVKVYDVRGHCVRVLGDGVWRAGEGRLDWDGCDDAGRILPSGAYFARVVRPTVAAETVKLVLVR